MVLEQDGESPQVYDLDLHRHWVCGHCYMIKIAYIFKLTTNETPWWTREVEA